MKAMEVIVIIGVVATVLTLVVMLVDRRRDKPIIVAHEERGRHFSNGILQTDWVVEAYLTGEGKQDAFNVRFGVQMHGVRFAFRMRPEDPGTGNRQRVIKPGERRPGKGAWQVVIPQTSIWSGKGDPDPGRFYWCRYQDADGRTWETLNPGDRSRNMRMARRVHFVGARQRLEEWRRRRAQKRGEKWMRDALAELVEAAEEAKAAEKSSQAT
jgi:hypothetical protein